MSTLRLIVIVAILILALSFFGISIRNIAESPVGKDNFTFVLEILKTVWHILVGWYNALVHTIEAALPAD